MNDEQTEVGGLGYFGAMQKNGKPYSGASMSFDRYQQDQQIQIYGFDADGRHHAGLIVNDVVDGVERPVFFEQYKQAAKEGKQQITQRVYAGKNPQGDSELKLADASGKTRLALHVSPSGEVQIVFFNTKGEITKTITDEKG